MHFFNELLRIGERKFAVFTLLLFSDVLTISSYYNGSEGSGPIGVYTTSIFDRLIQLMQFGAYAFTLFLLIARFKTIVRPVLRDPFLFALMGIIACSFIWSDFPYMSRSLGIRVLLTTLFGLYMASRYTLKEQLRIIAWALGIAAVFSFLYTLARPGAGIENGFHSGAWRGPLIHKNLFARLMVVSAMSLLLVALNTHRKRYIAWGAFAIAALLVILSTSKTALVIFLTLLLLLPFYNALRWTDSIAIPFFISLILIGGSAATWVAGNWDSLLYSLGKDPTLSGRTYLWDAIAEKILQRPWLGYGYKAFWMDGGQSEYVWRAIRYKVYQSHNGFLGIAVEIGIVGLALFLLSILFTYLRGIKWARTGKTSEELWPITYVTYFLMYNYTESTIIEPNSIFWALFVSVTLSLKTLRPVKVREADDNLKLGLESSHSSS